jgi:hypothetical protein
MFHRVLAHGRPPEYRKARNSLGDASASYPAAQYSKGERIDLAVVSALLGDLHMAGFSSHDVSTPPHT